MKITLEQLKEMVSEAVKARLSEATVVSEGAKEIPIRMVLDDIKDVVVGSIVEDLVRELRMDEKAVEMVVSRAFDKMVKEIVLGLDMPGHEHSPEGLPRRRVVAVGGM